MKTYIFKKNYFIFFLFTLISFFLPINLLELSLLMPNSLQLLDLSNLIVASDGIHFYNQDLTVEYTEKRKVFTLAESNLSKVAMAQFSDGHGGYIIILVNDVIYLYKSNKDFMKSQNFSEIINSEYYSLIPYKKDNSNLIFYISCFLQGNSTINIVKFNYDLSNEGSDLTYQINNIQVYKDITSKADSYAGLSCLLMSPPTTLTINNDLLTCFYYVSYPPILSANSFNPEDNLKEIENFKHFQITTGFDYLQAVSYAKTNNNKKKVLIFSQHNFKLYWATYDYINQFSPVYSENSDYIQISEKLERNKMFYFEQTNEFVTASGYSNGGCNKFVMVFKNYRLYYKGVLEFPDHSNGCRNTKSFTVYHNGLNYTILTDNGEQVSWNKLVNEIQLIEIDNYVSDYIEEEPIITTIIATTYLEAPTTITTTYLEPPTTIITTYLEPPTTIITTYIGSPTTIITSFMEIPTTITTTHLEAPSTIITTYLESSTTIIVAFPMIITTPQLESLTTITTTYLELSTTITTTYLELPTTITTTQLEPPKSITSTYLDLFTTIITTDFEIPNTTFTTNLESPSTIITTYLESLTTNASTTKVNTPNYLNDTKCKTSSPESALYNLCTSCNNDDNYFEVYFPENDFLHHFTECYNKTTKPINFYFDKSTQQYKPCYETCLTCQKGGNFQNNNCITCDVNYIKKPGLLNTSNCVTECFYYYYYSSYGQYKCTNRSKCPQEAPLLIKDLKKCTNDCKKEGIYKYQYGGQCIKNCPKDTSPENNICISNLNFCTKTDNEIDLNDFNTFKEVDLEVKDYVVEFRYTKRHVSYYNNSLYSILIYKDINCIDELEINMAKIDFGDCYSKILENIRPPTSDNIVVALIEKENDDKKSIVSFSFYHPETGEKLDSENLCKDAEIIIKENVLYMLNKTEVDVNSILHLTQQDINIFNLSNEFYTDMCYDFVSQDGKDVPLKDRIKTYFPNISLCDTGCNSKGVNLTTMESICECKFNEIIKNEIIEGNAFIQNALGGITDIISSSNILVLQCYKNVFKKKYIIKGYGAFIITFIAFMEFVFSFVFFLYDMAVIKKYLYNLAEYFLVFINKNKNRFNIINNNPSHRINKKIKAPPKRVNRIKKKTENPISSKRIALKFGKESTKKYSFNEDNSKVLNSMRSESKIIIKKGPIIKFSNKNVKKCNNLTTRVKIVKKEDLEKLIKAKKQCGVDMDEYLKTDLDDMDYDDAIKLDKRTFCEFFNEKLKGKLTIINAFCNKENLRPMSIKIILLFLNVDLYFVINGLFFDDEYLSSLFHSKEKETFFSFIQRSINRFFYMFIVGKVVGIIIDCIFFEERKIKRIFIREKDNPFQLKYEISLAEKSIKSRYATFIAICIFISIISWYYISCFNNTYPGVKIEWIKSSALNIIIMQILSILIAFLQAILRELSFQYKMEKLFKFQQYI